MEKDRPTIEKTPAEKKRLSYERDGRNSYGENAKASRKAIPLRKAKESRKDRHKAAADTKAITRADAETADLLESSARSDVYRIGGWKKYPDMPLGEWLQRQGKKR